MQPADIRSPHVSSPNEVCFFTTYIFGRFESFPLNAGCVLVVSLPSTVNFPSYVDSSFLYKVEYVNEHGYCRSTYIVNPYN